MPQNHMCRIATAALLFALSGCDDSSGLSGQNKADDPAFNEYMDSLCDEMAGGTATIAHQADAACVGCDVDSAPNAIDGTDATFATISLPTGTQGILTVRATAQPGVVYAGGSSPALSFSAPRGENLISVVVRTYLDGVLQEHECMDSAHMGETDDGRIVIGVHATQPFNAVEASLNRNNTTVANTECGQYLSSSNAYDAGRPVEIRLHEFCHHFRLP